MRSGPSDLRGRPLEWTVRVIALGLAVLSLLACATEMPPATAPPPPSPSPPALDLRAAPTAPAPAVPTESGAPLAIGGSTATAQLPPPSATAPASATPTPLLSPAPTARGPITLMAVGDVMLARSVGERIRREGARVPFAGVEPLLREADLLVANLECAISERGEPQPKAYTFRAPPAAAEALAFAGVDVVSLANNHALDYGPAALADTIQLLGARGIATAGAGENSAAALAPAIVERNGLRVAFLAFVDVPVERGGFDARHWIATEADPGVAWADLQQIGAAVAAARAQADIVVVLLHFGFEGRTEPSAAQRAQAQAAIDAGAALVLGAHPHVLQAVEEYRGGVIAYSLGNFVFDGFDGAANQTAVFVAVLTPQGVSDYRLVPAIIDDGLPRLAGS